MRTHVHSKFHPREERSGRRLPAHLPECSLLTCGKKPVFVSLPCTVGIRLPAQQPSTSDGLSTALLGPLGLCDTHSCPPAPPLADPPRGSVLCSLAPCDILSSAHHPVCLLRRRRGHGLELGVGVLTGGKPPEAQQPFIPGPMPGS